MSRLKCLLYLTELQGLHLSGKKVQVPNFVSKKGGKPRQTSFFENLPDLVGLRSVSIYANCLVSAKIR